jgi:hypothetical protein
MLWFFYKSHSLEVASVLTNADSEGVCNARQTCELGKRHDHDANDFDGALQKGQDPAK